MNIVEAFIKFQHGLIILLSGLDGCGKMALAKNISRDFKIGLIDQRDFYREDYDQKVTFPNGQEVINYETDDAVDWDKFNEQVKQMAPKGVVISGFSFPVEKLGFKPNYYIHLTMSKQLCMEKRKIMDDATEKLKMNQLTFPYYLESMKKFPIDKIINTNDKNDDSIYDEVFDYLIPEIDRVVHKKPRPMARETPVQRAPGSTPNDQTYRKRKAEYEIEAHLLAKPRYVNNDDLNMFNNFDTILEDSSESESPYNGQILFIK